MLTLVATAARLLARDRVALGLTFVLPIAFFSVFAAAFSAMDDEGLRPVRTIVALDEGDPFAARALARLEREGRLDLRPVPLSSRAEAIDAVRRGAAAAAVVLPDVPSGIAAARDPILVYADRSNPLAAGVVSGTVRAAAAAAALDALGPVVPETLGPSVEVVDVLGRVGKRPSVAYFASGLGVLFMMFAAAGRGAILLEERENGVLGRILAARVGLGRLLVARWLFLVLLGTVQVSIMFAWAAVAFGLDLFNARSLAGVALLTPAAAAAAAGLGLLLASACQTRAQLNGVAVVAILALAAVGGNLFPAFLMPAWLQSVGRLTFNAWALSGYQEIFWYERGASALLPEIAGLVLAGLLMLLAAWALSRRAARSGALAS